MDQSEKKKKSRHKFDIYKDLDMDFFELVDFILSSWSTCLARKVIIQEIKTDLISRIKIILVK